MRNRKEASLITLNSQIILHLLSNSFPYGVGSKVEPKDKQQDGGEFNNLPAQPFARYKTSFYMGIPPKSSPCHPQVSQPVSRASNAVPRRPAYSHPQPTPLPSSPSNLIPFSPSTSRSPTLSTNNQLTSPALPSPHLSSHQLQYPLLTPWAMFWSKHMQGASRRHESWAITGTGTVR